MIFHSRFIRDTLIAISAVIICVALWLTYISPSFEHIVSRDTYEPSLSSEVSFERSLIPQSRELTGSVKIIDYKDGSVLVRLEGIKQKLEIPTCPNLQVLLTLDLDVKNSILLGNLKGTEGDMNYNLPKGEDIKNYSDIVVWCESFKSDYAHAPIISVNDKPLFLK